MSDAPSLYHLAYGYRSFEHQKRVTFPYILELARAMQRPLDVLDLSCGPAVLDGILLAELPGQIRSLHLADIDEGFLTVARSHLAPFGVPLHCYTTDLTRPESLPPLIDAVDLVVTTNAFFHTAADALEPIYRWIHRALRAGGVLVNHQTFGTRWRQPPRCVAQVFANGAIDHPLERELNRRTHLD